MCTDTASATADPAARQDLQHLQVDLVRLGAAAVLLRVRQPEQAGPAERADHLARELAARLEVLDPRRQLAVGQLGRQGEQVAGLVGGQDAFDRHKVTRSVVDGVEAAYAVRGAHDDVLDPGTVRPAR